MPKALSPDIQLPAGVWPEQSTVPDADVVTRALGGTGLPGVLMVDRMDAAGNQGAESVRTNWPRVSEAHTAATKLFELADLAVPGLDSPELAATNWQHLEAGYQAYERLGMEPQLVIAPEGRRLDFWQTFYSKLRQWQDQNQPGASHRLKNNDDGDGLFIHDDIRRSWDSLADKDQPGWSAFVVPTTAKAPVLEVDYEGDDENGTRPAGLTSIMNALEEAYATSSLEHSSIERYLTLQATRLQTGQRPVDDKIDGVNYWSWLKGTFTNGNGSTAAPSVAWRPGYGQVFVVWDKVGIRRGDLGVRPEVRG